MTLAVGTATVYILSALVLSEKGQDVRQIFVDFDKELSDQKGATFIQVVKVNGENKIIAAVNVTDVCTLERIVERLHLLAAVETTSEPVITYEDFGAEIGVTDTLTSPDRLGRDIRFFVESFLDYYGNTTAEFNAVLKQSVETVIRLKNNGTVVEQAYKHVAQRKISGFVILSNGAELDTVMRNATTNQLLGSNVHTTVKGVQPLADYVASRKCASGY